MADELLRELKEVIKRALRMGESEEQIEEPLTEDVFIETDEEYRRAFEDEVPRY